MRRPAGAVGAAPTAPHLPPPPDVRRDRAAGRRLAALSGPGARPAGGNKIIAGAPAEKERSLIAEPTHAALGNRTNLADAQAKGREAIREAADALAASVLPMVRQLQAAGVTVPRAIAAALNVRGIRTARGGEWHDSTVRNLLARGG